VKTAARRDNRVCGFSFPPLPQHTAQIANAATCEAGRGEPSFDGRQLAIAEVAPYATPNRGRIIPRVAA
jgi:hypothetical protein